MKINKSQKAIVFWILMATTPLMFFQNCDPSFEPNSHDQESLGETDNPNKNINVTILENKSFFTEPNLFEPGSTNPISSYLHQSPTQGTLDLIPEDGSFRYTPDTNYVGADQFSLKVKDESGRDMLMIYSITIRAP